VWFFGKFFNDRFWGFIDFQQYVSKLPHLRKLLIELSCIFHTIKWLFNMDISITINSWYNPDDTVIINNRSLLPNDTNLCIKNWNTFYTN
jgi:hypothetical protein